MVCSMSQAWIHGTKNIFGNVKQRIIKSTLGFKGVNEAGGECLFNAALITEKR